MKISIIKNLTILLSFGLIVKLLGLFNKIILSRALEISGLAYYTKLLPIATLFMTIASFSLGPVITQIVSKNISKRPYSNRDLIKKSFVTATTTATIVSIIHLVFNYLICHYLLRMDILIKPFLFFIPLYFLQSYTAIFKGYFHGYGKMEVYAVGQLIEQIVRIILVYIFIIPQIKISIINGVVAAILTLSIGEIIQNIYMFICVISFTKLKGKTEIKTEYKDIIKPAINLTLNKLLSAICMFLEPIIYTYAFLKTGLSTSISDEFYAIIHGYALPIILTTNFICVAIEGAILPSLTINYANKNQKKMDEIINRSLILCFITGAIVSFVLFNFSYEIMHLFYKTTKGALYIKIMAIPSFIAYFEGVFVSLLIATNNDKKLVLNTIITNVIHLILIYFFVSNPYFNAMGLVISFSVIMCLSTIVLFILSKKNTSYKLKFKYVFLSIIIYILFMLLSIFL